MATGINIRRRAMMPLISSSEEPESKYIISADSLVEEILMSKGISSDGIGITKQDAELVYKIPRDFFEENSSITSFDELVYFPNAEVERYAFNSCDSLKSIDFSHQKQINEAVCHNCTSLEIAKGIENAYSFYNHAFQFTKISGELHLKNATYIGKFAFSQCTKLTKLLLDKVETIDGQLADHSGCFGSFGACENVTEIIMPKIKTIGIYAFWHNYAARKVYIGADCSYIGVAAFQGCKIDGFVIEAKNPPKIESNTFVECVISNLYVPDESVEAYKTSSYWSGFASVIKPLSEYQQ